MTDPLRGIEGDTRPLPRPDPHRWPEEPVPHRPAQRASVFEWLALTFALLAAFGWAAALVLWVAP